MRVGFVATRLAGTDGVSPETAKWDSILEELGHKTFYFAGELDRPPERSMLCEEAHFEDAATRELHSHCYTIGPRSGDVTREIQRRKDTLKTALMDFIGHFDIDLLVPENALTIPIQIPLGLGITEVIAETGLPTLAHHHDFFWERKRFMINNVWDYLNMAFPPHLPGMQHAVINSSANNQLSLRTGISAHEIPNVMDFGNPPDPPDSYTVDVREALGVAEDSLLILQPTRVVKRKGIEMAIEFTRRLGRKATLVITHASGDEGYEYQERIREYSEMMDVDTVFVDEVIKSERGRTPDGRKVYTLEDVYPYADLVTYPSTFEGFGNAFLEAVYYKKPIVVNNYAIFHMDIKPKGFDVIELDDYVNKQALELAREVLSDPARVTTMVEHNYALAQKHYSFATLRAQLRAILSVSFSG